MKNDRAGRPGFVETVISISCPGVARRPAPSPIFAAKARGGAAVPPALKGNTPMPNPRPARPIRRERMCRSNLRRQRNKAWLQRRLVEELLGVADLIERKRAEGAAEMASVYQAGGPPMGPP